MANLPDGRLIGGDAAGGGSGRDARFAELVRLTTQRAAERLEAMPAASSAMPRRMLAEQIGAAVGEVLSDGDHKLDLSAQRDLVAVVLEELSDQSRSRAQDGSAGKRDGIAAHSSAAPVVPDRGNTRTRIDDARRAVQPLLLERLDIAAASQLPRKELVSQITEVVGEIVVEQRLKLNLIEQRELVTVLIDDMLGLGPLEPLLADETVTDIMVNGPKQIYVERRGKLELTSAVFRDNAHVLNVATRIVSRIGRRVDESVPLVDARLEDGSRVNIIIPPLAIDGPSISIRKFAKKSITLDTMSSQGNTSAALSTVLKIASRCRLNVVISGGTGSGKTTLLNAMSQMIDHGERVVTIEDAAELQLQQPHVVRLETRPANLEGNGEVDVRDLVKNALRMRPDRIILGEVRSGEAIDMLQAMNTGHDGSMCTLHANRPRQALTRLENMVAMSGVELPARAVRTQIADAVNLIVQISRMRDGMRRVTYVTEIVGMEGDVVVTQDLFNFEFDGLDAGGRMRGRFKCSALRPNFLPRAEQYGFDKQLLEAMECLPSQR
ncbi:MAG: CpaF family protein [Alphaproteobacteria bacterium]